MSDSTEDQTLDTCGCCGTDASTPRIHNRPGLPSISYRLRTHTTSLAAMKARLAGPDLIYPRPRGERHYLLTTEHVLAEARKVLAYEP